MPVTIHIKSLKTLDNSLFGYCAWGDNSNFYSHYVKKNGLTIVACTFIYAKFRIRGWFRGAISNWQVGFKFSCYYATYFTKILQVLTNLTRWRNSSTFNSAKGQWYCRYVECGNFFEYLCKSSIRDGSGYYSTGWYRKCIFIGKLTYHNWANIFFN